MFVYMFVYMRIYVTYIVMYIFSVSEVYDSTEDSPFPFICKPSHLQSIWLQVQWLLYIIGDINYISDLPDFIIRG